MHNVSGGLIIQRIVHQTPAKLFETHKKPHEKIT